MSETSMTAATAPASKKSFSLGRLVPLVIIVGAALTAIFVFDVGQYLTLDSVRENRQWLLDQVAANPVLAPFLFIAAYIGVVALSLPGATWMTLIGGFLFGVAFGTAYVVLGATIGATLIFLAARTALGDWLLARAGGWVDRLRDGFQENALSYMLVLRLVPLFPFFVVNLAPAFLGVRLSTFVLATFFGIIPGTAVYVTFGAGLGAIFDSGKEPSLAGVLSPELIAGLVGMALLALVPVVYKRLSRRKA